MMLPNSALLEEFRTSGLCQLCRRWAEIREPHHLRAKAAGGNGVIEIRINLISLGGSVRISKGRRRFSCACHHQAHNLAGATERILVAVAARESVRPADITEVMDWLRRLVKPTPGQLEAALDELSPSARSLAIRELAEWDRRGMFKNDQ